MVVPDLVGLFVGPLEGQGVAYMITGGVAVVIYGEPRFTRDIDLVMELGAGDARRFAAAFDDEAFYVPPAETIEEEAGRSQGGHFNLIHRASALRADVYLAGDDPLHAWALARRRRIAVDDAGIWIAPLEYVVLRKLQYHRASGSERHLRDIATMLRTSPTLLNRGDLDDWLHRLGLEAAWRAATGWAE